MTVYEYARRDAGPNVIEPAPEALLLEAAELLVRIAIQLDTIAKVLHARSQS